MAGCSASTSPRTSTGRGFLSVGLRRAVGNTSESHFYGFTLAADSVTVAPDLSSATLDTGTQLGQFGSMMLTFGNAGAFATGTPAFGCTTGTWQMRTGTMTSQVSFVADKTYFQTIVETSLPADVSANTGDPPTCTNTPTGACVHDESLGVSSSPTGPFVYAFGGDLANGGTGLFEFMSEKIAPATISHTLREINLPAGDLTVAPDLSSASVSTTGASLFTGSLSFTASAPATSGPYAACGGMFTTRAGTTTGGIVGHFLAIPATVPLLGQSFLSMH
jgi:hypothetical protein